MNNTRCYSGIRCPGDRTGFHLLMNYSKLDIMKYLACILTLLLFAAGCKEKSVTVTQPYVPPPPPPKAQEVYVLNAGNPVDSTGASISIYDITNDTTYLNVFEAANGGAHLGAYAVNMKLAQGHLFILMGGAMNSLLLTRASDTKLTEQYNFSSPIRDFIIDSLRSQAFVIRGDSGWVYVMNLASFAITESLAVGANSTGLFTTSNHLYISDATSNLVTVIDMNSDTVKTKVHVGAGPSSMGLITTGRLKGSIAVACTGDSVTKGSVTFIDTLTNAVSDSLDLSVNLFSGGGVGVNSDGYVFVLGTTIGVNSGGPVIRINPNTKAYNLSYVAGTYYSVTIDGATDDIYLANVKQFTQNGEVNVYKSSAALKKVIPAEMGPKVVLFRR